MIVKTKNYGLKKIVDIDDFNKKYVVAEIIIKEDKKSIRIKGILDKNEKELLPFDSNIKDILKYNEDSFIVNYNLGIEQCVLYKVTEEGKLIKKLSSLNDMIIYKNKIVGTYYQQNFYTPDGYFIDGTFIYDYTDGNIEYFNNTIFCDFISDDEVCFYDETVKKCFLYNVKEKTKTYTEYIDIRRNSNLEDIRFKAVLCEAEGKELYTYVNQNLEYIKPVIYNNFHEPLYLSDYNNDIDAIISEFKESNEILSIFKLMHNGVREYAKNGGFDNE